MGYFSHTFFTVNYTGTAVPIPRSAVPCSYYFSLLFLSISLPFLDVQYVELNFGHFENVIEETLVAVASHGFHVKLAPP